MEYLMTYGWAILIIAVVLGALFQLGVFNSSSFAPKAPPGACQVFRPNGPGTITNINLMGVCTGQLPQYVSKFNGLNYNSVVVADALNLDSSSFSVSTWFYMNSKHYGDPYYIVQKGIWAAVPTGTGWAIYIYPQDTGTLYLAIMSTVADASRSYGVISSKVWYHLAMSFNGTTNGYAFYVNGQSIYSSTLSGSYLPPTGSQLNMMRYLNGSLSNVQLYNTSLSANQIQTLYLGGIGGAPMKLQNLVGWWPLNGNANDYSGNNNNGVPTGVTFTSQYGK